MVKLVNLVIGMLPFSEQGGDPCEVLQMMDIFGGYDDDLGTDTNDTSYPLYKMF